jgi:protein-tyrosine phosphatase
MNNVKSNIIGIQVREENQACFEKSMVFYLAWPDQSCPDVAQPLIELVQNVEKSRLELSDANKFSGPVVVHCR